MSEDHHTSAEALENLLASSRQQIVLAAPTNEQEMVAQALVVATQPSFIDKVNERLGDPKHDETREAYVERGKEAVIAQLRHILG